MRYSLREEADHSHPLLSVSLDVSVADSRHCRDASVYGHKTTAIHDMSASLYRPTPGGSNLKKRSVLVIHAPFFLGAPAQQGCPETAVSCVVSHIFRSPQMRPNILCQDCHASQVWTTVLMPLPCHGFEVQHRLFAEGEKKVRHVFH